MLAKNKKTSNGIKAQALNRVENLKLLRYINKLSLRSVKTYIIYES